jgi:hypothetical protein
MYSALMLGEVEQVDNRRQKLVQNVEYKAEINGGEHKPYSKSSSSLHGQSHGN